METPRIYMKKPEFIHAQQFTGQNNPFDVLQKHKCDNRMCPICGGENQEVFYISDIFGNFSYAQPGDFIVRMENNSYFPFNPTDFQNLYEEVE